VIEFESTAAPVVRCLESDVAGRRVAVVAVPYSGEVGTAESFRFDPIERRLFARRPAGRVTVGPADTDAWSAAVSRCPAGPVLVGPSSPAEEIRGAWAAAAEGTIRSGRGAFLLDPDGAGLPAAAPGRLVLLVSWSPGAGEADFERRLSAGSRDGVAAGGLLPILPGWTDEAAFLERWFARAAAAGAHFVAAIAPAEDGEARRTIVEARAALEPAAADEYFRTVHHGDWAASVRSGLRRFREEARRRGLPAFPPRPRGEGEPEGNSAAAARLEERAVELEEDEHRSALLQAAARWIDESGRDLAPVVREGNFGKVFPFGSLAAEAEAAFRTGSGT
jgi:hypothetical protein